ncbi:ABC-type transport auxiliary lipoprotein family protein [Falsiroseomonas sp. HC035]|uniref:ABC-type transport auxiliary lipoprotein family protein n=1 Tax=Falsiroseomonas sp. HC035 TaxID=3390999 RepID=UPI003D31A1B3
MNRRALLLSALAPVMVAGCSILPDRPDVPVRRFALNPRRPSSASPPARGRVLLVRRVRAVPGLQDLGLRRLRPDGAYEILPYEEWLAPPGDLVDAALRGWLQDSGLFSAVVGQGSRADADLVLEMQLTVLEAAPAAGQARAGLAGVLLREGRAGTGIVGTLEAQAEAPLAADARAPEMAAAMSAALALTMGRLEADLARLAR